MQPTTGVLADTTPSHTHYNNESTMLFDKLPMLLDDVQDVKDFCLRQLTKGYLELRPSEVSEGKDTGWGVFTTDKKTYVKDEVITFYDGPVVHYDELMDVFKAKHGEEKIFSHARSLFFKQWEILGNFHPQTNEPIEDPLQFCNSCNYGLGAFINDAYGPAGIPWTQSTLLQIRISPWSIGQRLVSPNGSKQPNVAFRTLLDKRNDLFDESITSYDPKGKVVLVVATKDIQANEELLTYYGSSYQW